MGREHRVEIGREQVVAGCMSLRWASMWAVPMPRRKASAEAGEHSSPIGGMGVVAASEERINS